MSGPLVDKQQTTCENVEIRKFSLGTQVNLMFSTCSPIFCCLSARGLEVSLHFWQSWPTVWHAANSNQAQVSPSHSAEVTKFLALPDMRSLSTQSREAHGS